METRPSRLGGRGLFAREPFSASEVVVIWGGRLFSEEELHAGTVRPGSAVAVEEGVCLAGGPEAAPDDADLMNHSCDPNVWMLDEVTLVARRDIAAGEELAADYAMWEADEEWSAQWECACGAALCRGMVTGRDWRVRELQERYAGHFSPFINRRIGGQAAPGSQTRGGR